ncbi:ATP synthase F1 subcomplex epsilon subunit [Anseongella ginsenosidimutans]|uniref:ATP synthase F1 subcomplex epsilon subunit n=1 Tax=Anseongella ginsenosidimutans TaxID=496056 RepID=A0A4R3KJJ1_9SPHI|nr:ATP synthase F1 subunit epsilon [Anseongella ginsenosidimutans]QEC53832.1 ATP synthase F1 subunit epsilon [Anseongella ginsenosidimutans]TCS83891.1 ATP synthase F1 subcomplex epsilon subunit [Anseongella ginsenosidimutans]
MTLEILTPDKKVFSGEATSVTVPGTQGSFTVLNNHAPIISTLEAGEVKVKGNQGMETFHINGGVIEVLKNKVVLLAESLS